jgi:hypothetical protein
MVWRPTPAPGATVGNLSGLLLTLRTSPTPAQREQAALAMTAVDWKTHPEVVQALLTAVCTDQVSAVRAQCVACLARMNASTPEVIITLQVLKQDSDMDVQAAVRQALVQLKGTQSVRAN